MIPSVLRRQMSLLTKAKEYPSLNPFPESRGHTDLWHPTNKPLTAINHGPESYLVVKPSESSPVYTHPSTLIASTPNIKIQSLVRIPHASGPASRVMAGGPMFMDVLEQEKSDEREPVSALIATNTGGSVASFDLDGSSEYYIQPKALLAFSGPDLHISVDVPEHTTFFRMPWFFYRLSGKGQVGMTTTMMAGIIRYQLKEGERLFVEHRHVLAWESSLQCSVYNPIVISSQTTQSHTKNPVSAPDTSNSTQPKESPKGIQAFIRKWYTKSITIPLKNAYNRVISFPKTMTLTQTVDTLGTTLKDAAAWTARAFQWMILDKQGYWIVQGPGTIYLSSRRRVPVIRSSPQIQQQQMSQSTKEVSR